jgi:hypothetical protein
MMKEIILSKSEKTRLWNFLRTHCGFYEVMGRYKFLVLYSCDEEKFDVK